MRVLFDHQIFTVQRYGGISRYFSRLAEALPGQGVAADIVAPIHQNQYLKELRQTQVHGYGFKRFPPRTGRIVTLMNQWFSNRVARRLNPDVIHETYYASSPLEVRARVRVTTVHDMIHEKFAHEFAPNDPTARNKREAVNRADHVICVSHSTKRDLCELYNVSPDKVTVVHLGFETLSSSYAADDRIAQDTKPFLLYVGARYGYKNFAQFLKAVAMKTVLKETFGIVAFGGGAFSTEEQATIRSLGFRDGAVKQVGGADEILGSLYSQAAAFVYPSRYEGFGLPPLEAIACDCPVVTSNKSSMPEVIGPAGEYCDPNSAESIADAIEKVVFDEQRKAELVKLGRERLQLFSWRKCALETASVYLSEPLIRAQ